jgi:hypothetical protein
MGLFDAFRGGQAPGVYAPWMTYDPGAPQITPSQPVTPAGPLDTSPQSVTIPKGPSFWDRMNAADPNTGLSKWQQLGLVGASLRDDPSVFANQQNSMMEQGKLALSNQMTRQQMALASAFAHGMRGGGSQPTATINGQPVPQVPQSPTGGTMVPQAGAGGLPVIPGAAQPMVTPEMRQLASLGAFQSGKYDQAVSILDDDGHYTVTPQGYVLNGKSGQVVGQVPNFQYINNVRVNPNDPNSPAEIPKLPDGMVHLTGGGAANANGLTAAMAAQSSATARATEAAKASQDVIDVKMPDGSVQQVPRDVAAALTRQSALGGVASGAGGAQAPGGFGRSQTPADAAYAADTAKNAVGMYQGIQTAGPSGAHQYPEVPAPRRTAGRLQRQQALPHGRGTGAVRPQPPRPWQLRRQAAATRKRRRRSPTNSRSPCVTPSQGGGMPGALSNSDRDFLVRSVPNLARPTRAASRWCRRRSPSTSATPTSPPRRANGNSASAGSTPRTATGKTFSDYLKPGRPPIPCSGAPSDPVHPGLIASSAQKYGLDPALLSRLASTESGGDPNARSPAGAMGVMQLMPGTARDLGVDPSDPAQNIDGGAHYLKQQLDRFGSPELALAAYNAGPGRVARAGGVPNIPETQAYVGKVMGGGGPVAARGGADQLAGGSGADIFGLDSPKPQQGGSGADIFGDMSAPSQAPKLDKAAPFPSAASVAALGRPTVANDVRHTSLAPLACSRARAASLACSATSATCPARSTARRWISWSPTAWRARRRARRSRPRYPVRNGR